MKMKLPKYVRLFVENDTRGTAMRLQTGDDGEPEYWRDAGLWGIGVREAKTGDCVGHDAKRYSEELSYLDGCRLIECSREEWEKDNEGYV